MPQKKKLDKDNTSSLKEEIGELKFLIRQQDEYNKALFQERDILNEIKKLTQTAFSNEKKQLLEKFKILDIEKNLQKLTKEHSYEWKDVKKQLSDTADIAIMATKSYEKIGKESFEIVDVSHELAETQQLINIYTNSNLELNEEQKKSIIEYLNFNKDILEQIQAQTKQFKQLDTQIKYGVQSITKFYDKTVEWLEKLPGGRKISMLMGLDQIGKDFKEKVAAAFSIGAKGITADMKAIRTAGVGAFKAIYAAAKSLIILFATNPILIAITLITTAIALFIALLTSAYKRWKDLQIAGENFRKEMGLIRGQTVEIDKGINRLYWGMKEFAISAEDAYKVYSAIIEANRGLLPITQKQTSEMHKTADAVARYYKLYGIMPELTAKVVRNFEIIGRHSNTTALALTDQLTTLAWINGMSPQTAFKDISENVDKVAFMLGKQPSALLRTTIMAHRLGLELNDISNMVEGFLDYESSIEKEMIAQVVLGRRLNLDAARQYAFAGKWDKVLESVIENIGGIHELNKLGMIELRFLSDATGLSMDKLLAATGRYKEDISTKTAVPDFKDVRSDLTIISNSIETMKRDLIGETGILPKIDETIRKLTEFLSGEGMIRLGNIVDKIGGAISWLGKATSWLGDRPAFANLELMGLAAEKTIESRKEYEKAITQSLEEVSKISAKRIADEQGISNNFKIMSAETKKLLEPIKKQVDTTTNVTKQLEKTYSERLEVEKKNNNAIDSINDILIAKAIEMKNTDLTSIGKVVIQQKTIGEADISKNITQKKAKEIPKKEEIKKTIVETDDRYPTVETTVGILADESIQKTVKATKSEVTRGDTELIRLLSDIKTLLLTGKIGDIYIDGRKAGEMLGMAVTRG